MIYNAYFEMATAVMLFILIIVYFWKKNLPVQSNRLYLNVLILLVIETCLSAAQCYYECRNDIMSSFAAYVVNSAAFTVLYSLCIIARFQIQVCQDQSYSETVIQE